MELNTNHIMNQTKKKMKTTNDMHEINGSHYESLKYEPVHLYQSLNQISWFQAEPIKYLSRFKLKNGVNDLNKAKHILSMARDLGIKRPYELVIQSKFTSDYMVQFGPWFSESKDPTVNEKYFGIFCSLVIHILLAEWDLAIHLMDDITYYFYGEEEQNL